MRSKVVLSIAIASALTMTACSGRSNSSSHSGGNGYSSNSPGITNSSILIGSSTALTGPVAAFGNDHKAVGAYFDYINSQGGVKMGDGKQRKIKWVYYDDAYQPQRAVVNVKRLVEQTKVFALTDTLGTASNAATQPYLAQQKVPDPFIGSGASQFGNISKFPYSFGFSLAYAKEGAIYASYLKKSKPKAKIGILYQNDDLGTDYLNGFVAEATKLGLSIVSKQSYEATDATVDSQMVTLQKSGADTLFLATTPKFATQALQQTGQLGWHPLKIVNFVSSPAQSTLIPAGRANSTGVISATTLKDVTSPQFANDAGVLSYKRIIQKYAPQLDYRDQIVENGFAIAYAFVKILEQTKKPTREGLNDAAHHLDITDPLLYPGIIMRTTPTDAFPVESMQLQQFNGTNYVPLGGLQSI